MTLDANTNRPAVATLSGRYRKEAAHGKTATI